MPFDILGKASRKRYTTFILLVLLKVVNAFEVTTLAGDDKETSDGYPSTAEFNAPRGIGWTGNSNDFYFIDTDSDLLRFYDDSSIFFSTIAGEDSKNGHVDGEGTDVRFRQPEGLIYDQNSDLVYIADKNNNVIRTYNPSTNKVNTVVGHPSGDGHTDGFGVAAEINHPFGFSFSPDGTILWLACEQSIRRIELSSYEVTTLWEPSEYTKIRDLAAGPNNEWVYFVDEHNHVVGKVSVSSGLFKVAAGYYGSSGHENGFLAAAKFDSPMGIAYVPQTNMLFVADKSNYKIRQVDLNYVFALVSDLAGSSKGQVDGTDPFSVKFKNPEYISFNPYNSNLFVLDERYIRIVDADITWPPTVSPTTSPSTHSPSLSPSKSPSRYPTISPSVSPTRSPSLFPSNSPSRSPSASPSKNPTISPTMSPTLSPSLSPSKSPTLSPSFSPSLSPTFSPTTSPLTNHPSTMHPSTVHPGTDSPSISPSASPTVSPTISPTLSPSLSPSKSPTLSPSFSPSLSPTFSPTTSPLTNHPSTMHPSTVHPGTDLPSISPSASPTISPTQAPSTIHPSTSAPTLSPYKSPSNAPSTRHPYTTHPSTVGPTLAPSNSPSFTPTSAYPSVSPFKSPSTSPTAPPSTAHPFTIHPTFLPRATALSVTLNGPKVVGKCTTTELFAVITTSDINVSIGWWANGIELTDYSTAQITITYAEIKNFLGIIPDDSHVNFSVKVSQGSSQTYFSEDTHLVTYLKTIHPAVTVIPVPGVISPSSRILLEGTVHYSLCQLNNEDSSNLKNLHFKELTYAWEIEKQIDGSLIGLQDPSNALSLLIAPNVLPANHSFIARLIVSGRLKSKFNISAIVGMTTIETGISNVVAKLNCGEYNEITTTSSTFVDASQSYDSSNIEDPSFVYKWKCNGACPMSLPANNSISSFTLPENSLPNGITFTLWMTYVVSSPYAVKDRENTAQCTFHTVSDAVPKVAIKAQSIVSTGSAVKIQTNASPHPLSPSTSSNQFTYSWFETASGIDISNINTPSAVIPPTILTPGNTYHFHVLVTDTLAQTTSSASVKVALRAGASINVDVQPSNGFEYLTRFSVNCLATVSEGGMPVAYQIIDTIDDNEPYIIRDWGGVCQMKSLLRNGQHTISVRVRDAYGSISVADANNVVLVDVSPPNACGGLIQASELLSALLQDYGLTVSYESSPGKRILQQITLLSQIAAHGLVLLAVSEILENIVKPDELQQLDENTVSYCIANTSYSGTRQYEIRMWEKFLSVTQIAITQQGNVYADLATQGLLSLMRSPFSPRKVPSILLNMEFDMVDTLIKVSNLNSLSSGFGRKLSRCLNILAKSNGLGTRVSSSLNNLLRKASKYLIPGESPVSYARNAFFAVTSVVRNNWIAPFNEDGGVNVVLQDVTDSSEMSLGIIKWNDGYPTGGPQRIPDGLSLHSSVVDVTLTNFNGENVQIHDDEGMGFIDITINFTEATKDDLECRYYNHDIEKWNTEGCEVYERGNFYITCRCTHLTEFAVMARYKEGEVFPTKVMRISYLCSAVSAVFLCFVALSRVITLSWTRQHRTWVAYIHGCIFVQTFTRGLSSLLFSGIVKHYSLDADPIIVCVVSALPYSFWFLTSSLIAFQWMSMTFNRVLRKDPFRRDKKWYFLSCTLCTVVVWITMAILWFEDVREMAIFGSAFITACCIILLLIYIISGYRMHQNMTRAFKIMNVSIPNARKQQKRLDDATKMRNITVGIAFGFPLLSVIWVTSIVFKSPSVLDIIIPAYLSLDATVVLSILIVYNNSIRKLSKSRSQNDIVFRRSSLMNKSNGRSSILNLRMSSNLKFQPANTSTAEKRRYSHNRRSILDRSSVGSVSPLVSLAERKRIKSRIQRESTGSMMSSSFHTMKTSGLDKHGSHITPTAASKLINLSLKNRQSHSPKLTLPKNLFISKTIEDDKSIISIASPCPRYPSPLWNKNQSGTWSSEKASERPSPNLRFIARNNFNDSPPSNDKKRARKRISEHDSSRESYGSRGVFLGGKSDVNLPAGWSEHFTLEGQAYYYNSQTKESTWDFPAKVKRTSSP